MELEQKLRLRIVCGDPEALISVITCSGIEVRDIARLDFLTIEITIRKRDDPAVRIILNKYDASYSAVQQRGLFWSAGRFIKRPVLICGMILFILMYLYTSGRVFFIHVSGNHVLSSEKILAQAETCGLSFGANASSVRSEDLKNKIMNRIPGLQWVGITTSGTVATIHVIERAELNSADTDRSQMFYIQALRDGIISRMTVEKGNPLVHTGQKVEAGDILVSGYTDCGTLIRAEQPLAEIFAYTLRKYTYLTPTIFHHRESMYHKHHCYRVRFGKKVINLCNHSGIQDVTCVKMYKEDFVSLPGDLRLPVSFTKITCYYYKTIPQTFTDNIRDWLTKRARQYVCQQMIAGEVLEETTEWDIDLGVYQLIGNYACQEMIGQVTNEEIMSHNAENN